MTAGDDDKCSALGCGACGDAVGRSRIGFPACTMSYSRLPNPLPRSMMRNFFAPRSGNERPPMTPARRRKLLFSYLPDW